jgi:Zn-dependent protease with chaperone function
MVPLAVIGSFGAAFLLSWGLNWLALIPWRRSAGQHWTERARILYPVRAGAAVNMYFVPAICFLSGRILWREDALLSCLSGIFGFTGAVAGTYPMSREMFPWVRFRGWFQQVSAGLFLRFGWYLIYFAAMTAMPDEFGWLALVIALAVLGVTLWLHWGLGLRIWRGFQILKPPPERLRQIISETAGRMNIPVRHVWLLQSPASYAAALPASRELIFSERLLELHPDDEVAAICAHELGHLAESRLVLAGRIVGSLTLFPLIFVKPIFHLAEPLNILVFAMLGLFVFSLSWLRRRLSRRREVRADKVATDNAINATTYARALERIYEANQMPAVMRSNRMIHPHLYDRMLTAGVTPDYPRPKRPGVWGWNVVVVWVILAVLLVLGNTTF